MRARLHVQGASARVLPRGHASALRPALLAAAPRRYDRRGGCRLGGPAATGMSDGRSLELGENVRRQPARAVSRGRHHGPRRLALDALLDLPGVTGFGIARAGVPLAAAGSPVVADDFALEGPTGATATLRLQRHVTGFFQGNRFLLQHARRARAGAGTRRTGDGPLCRRRPVRTRSRGAGTGRGPRRRERPGQRRGPRKPTRRPMPNTSRSKRVRSRRRCGSGAPLRAGRVIVDPPRTGLSREAGAALAAARPTRLVYVSCDVATLARDVGRLAAAGFDRDAVELFDLFPGTAHVETLVSLTPARLTRARMCDF